MFALNVVHLRPFDNNNLQFVSSYKQRRFNLFREESEGYAKLITELNDESIEKSSVLNLLEIIKSLIGS